MSASYSLTEEELDAFLEEEIFCFECGIGFKFNDGCRCSGFAMANWVMKPIEIDSCLFFPANTCIISSFDGSADLAANDPFLKNEP